MALRPDPLSENPAEFWAQRAGSAKMMETTTQDPKDPVPAGKARIVCISDTHSQVSKMSHAVPDGDILIHAGDFTLCGHLDEVRQFNSWLGSLPHPHKIVVAGNHDLSFDPNFRGSHHSSSFAKDLDKHYAHEGKDGQQEEVANDIKKELTNCIYLEDQSVTLRGIKIHGSPWQPEYKNWAFNLPRGEALLDKWKKIPDDTDILVTHTPPVGYGDLTDSGLHVGCVDLLNSVTRRIKPKFHVFGHVHEGYGVRSDGKTVFVNASICNYGYQPENKPIIFDISAKPSM